MTFEKKPIEHGTAAGYRQEVRRKKGTCPACRTAWREYLRRYRKEAQQKEADKADHVLALWRKQLAARRKNA